MKMKVTRPFLLAGKRQEIGTKFETDDRGLIGLLTHEGKAIPLEPIKTTGPMTTETTGTVIAGGKDKPAEPAKPAESKKD